MPLIRLLRQCKSTYLASLNTPDISIRHEVFHIPTIEHKIVEARYLRNRSKLGLPSIESITTIPDGLSASSYIKAVQKVSPTAIAHLQYLKSGLTDVKKESRICSQVYLPKKCLVHCGAARTVAELS